MVIGGALGGRVAPLDDDQASAPRDEDDDLLERLCCEAFDRLTAAFKDGNYDVDINDLEHHLGEVRFRQMNRCDAALRCLYRGDQESWNFKPLQHAEARRIWLVHRALYDPLTNAHREAIARADELIAKYSKPPSGAES